jgi:hypothetical protein
MARSDQKSPGKQDGKDKGAVIGLPLQDDPANKG